VKELHQLATVEGSDADEIDEMSVKVCPTPVYISVCKSLSWPLEAGEVSAKDVPASLSDT